MSIYNIIAKNKITTPFIQFTKEQNRITEQINDLFSRYLKTRMNVRSQSEFERFQNIINSNNIIYNNERIILFNFVELLSHDSKYGNELIIKVLHPINHDYLTIINCFNMFYREFLMTMSEWKRIFNTYNGVEFQVPINDLNNLKLKVLTGKISKENFTVIPFHEHFKKYLDKFSKTLDKNIDTFTLLINFESTELSKVFSYNICLQENIKGETNNYQLFENVIVEKNNVDDFLKNLFLYGKL